MFQKKISKICFNFILGKLCLLKLVINQIYEQYIIPIYNAIILEVEWENILEQMDSEEKPVSR